MRSARRLVHALVWLLSAACAGACTEEEVPSVTCAGTCPAGTRRAAYEAVATGRGVSVVSASCEVYCESVMPCLFPNVPTSARQASGEVTYSCAPLEGYSDLGDDTQADFSWAGDGDPPCRNGVRDEGEEELDCGGPRCVPCGCADGLVGGDETGVDCGGPCDPCDACANFQLDGDETDVDCGGSCGDCDLGRTCLVAADCSSAYCDASQGAGQCVGLRAPTALLDTPGARVILGVQIGYVAATSLLVSSSAPPGIEVWQADSDGALARGATLSLAAEPTDLRLSTGSYSGARVAAAVGAAGVQLYSATDTGPVALGAVGVGGVAARAAYHRGSQGGDGVVVATLAGGGLGVAFVDLAGASATAEVLDAARTYTDVIVTDLNTVSGTATMAFAVSAAGVTMVRLAGAAVAGVTDIVATPATAVAVTDVDYDAAGHLEVLAASPSDPSVHALAHDDSLAFWSPLATFPAPGAGVGRLLIHDAWIAMVYGSSLGVLYRTGASLSAGTTLVTHELGATVTGITMGSAYDGNTKKAIYVAAGGKVYRAL